MKKSKKKELEQALYQAYAKRGLFITEEMVNRAKRAYAKLPWNKKHLLAKKIKEL